MLEVGQTFASRYQVRRLLGAGGMGAVFEAWDNTAETAVALKIIRPDSAGPSDIAALKQRLKQELRLARQVSHPNVVRIHDLGEAGEVMYITMALVEGRDLASILKSGETLTVAQALAIGRQLAAGLSAAHAAGVVHRDLKPANVMVTPDDRVLIMDFGIARSVVDATAPGVTGGGAVVGTLAYMAPEQAAAVDADERADIYAFGLILYEMLGGKRSSDPSGVNDLLQRMQQAPPPLHVANPLVPMRLSSVVNKCLQPDPQQRYARIDEVLQAFDGAGEAPTFSTNQANPRSGARRAILSAAALVAVAALGYSAWSITMRDGGVADAPEPARAIALIPFKNATGDPALDPIGALLTQVISTGLGRSTSIRLVDNARVAQVMRDLRFDPSSVAAAELDRVAELTSAAQLLTGQYSKAGSTFRIDLTLRDPRRASSISLDAQAAGENELLKATTALVATLQERLAQGSRSALDEMHASAWQPSTSSTRALQMYSAGLELRRQGQAREALEQFTAAVAADEGFALALSAMAVSTAALGSESEAIALSNRAIERAESLLPQERNLVMAAHYRLTNETAKALKAYEGLAKDTPNDSVAHFDLGAMYEQTGRLDEAYAAFSKSVSLDPTYVDALLAVGRVAIRRGDAQASLEPLMKAQSLAVQLNNDRQRANILQATGIAYKTLNRPDDALASYEASLEIKRRIGDKRGIPSSLGEIAQIRVRQGRLDEAEKGYRAALEINRELGDRASASSTLINLAVLLNDNLGRPDAALPLLMESLQIRRELGNEVGQAMALNGIGNVYLTKGALLDAQTYFERALEIRQRRGPPTDHADTRHNLGEVALATGRVADAITHFQHALDLRRTAEDPHGTAIEMASLGEAFDATARYGAAVQSKREALDLFRSSKSRDVWLPELTLSYGRSLSRAGLTTEAEPLLAEGLTLARDINNPGLVTSALLAQSENAWLQGDRTRAATLSQDAIGAAKGLGGSQPTLRIAVDLNAAAIAARNAAGTASAGSLERIAREAAALPAPRLVLDAELERLTALTRGGSTPHLIASATGVLTRSEATGHRLLTARAYFLRAELTRGARQGFKRDYERARDLLRGIGAEAGAQAFIKRADVAAMLSACDRWLEQ